MQAVASAEGIDTLTSSSQQNVSTDHAQPAPRRQRRSRRLRRAVQGPAGEERPAARSAGPGRGQADRRHDVALMYMSFNSKVMTASQITDYLTRVVQPRLQTIDGVANAQILGGQTFAMRIWLNPDKMASLGHHAARCAQRAGHQQLRHRGRAGEGRLRPDQHQCADAARQRRRRSASWWWRRAATR